MKILSIDVGIKNLAFCLFDILPDTDPIQILKWDVVNLAEEETFKCNFIDKQVLCNKPAKYQKNTQCFCAKHAKNQSYKVPVPEYKSSSIKKYKLSKLHELAIKFDLTYEPKIKKTELATLINEYIDKIYLDVIERKNANDIDLFFVGKMLKTKFNELFQEYDCINTVIIENQIGPLAIRMKTIQGMLVQYFIMSHLKVENIQFVSSANKLKDCDVQDKMEYADRKKLGIKMCLEYLNKHEKVNKYLSYFKSHKKQDDLADSFLQGLWYINKHIL